MATPHPKGLATRQRLIESMLALIQAQGYHGSGLNTVLAHSKAPKGSLYFHFPEGKAELAGAAIALAGGQFRDLIHQATAGAGSVEATVDLLVSELRRILEASDYRAGCPVSAVMLDAGSENEELGGACNEVYDSWIDAVSEYIVSFGVKADDAGPLATSVICLVEGALILSRAAKSTRPLDAAASTLKVLLQTAAQAALAAQTLANAQNGAGE